MGDDPDERQRPRSPVEVRAALGQIAPASTALGAMVWLAAILAHTAAVAGALLAPHGLLQLCSGLLAGLTTGLLFIVGHDAAHGNLVANRRMNSWLARLAFLPALHPLQTWIVGHNKLHHGWTNLRGHDPGYPPLSPHEYLSLTTTARFVQRVYRSSWGFGLSYMLDIWLRRQILRRSPGYHAVAASRHCLELLGLACYLVCMTAGIVVSAHSAGWHGVTWDVLCVIVIPFVAWNYVMTFVTLMQHSHPRVRWYDRREDWDFFAGQVQSTVHVRMPAVIDWLSGRIFQHTAHHVDKSIPLYRLVEAQRRLAGAYREVVSEPFTWGMFRRVLTQCQLYDYRRHEWVRFEEAGSRIIPDARPAARDPKT